MSDLTAIHPAKSSSAGLAVKGDKPDLLMHWRVLAVLQFAAAGSLVLAWPHRPFARATSRPFSFDIIALLSKHIGASE